MVSRIRARSCCTTRGRWRIRRSASPKRGACWRNSITRKPSLSWNRATIACFTTTWRPSTIPYGFANSREILLYHTRALADPAKRIAEARRLLAQLDHPEAKSLLEQGDDSLFHDDLAPINDR